MVDRHTFKFADQKVSYSRDVDGEKLDAEVEHAIETTPLSTRVDDSWSETLFYGRGNERM